MDQTTHYKIVSGIWDIADNVLRDLFIRTVKKETDSLRNVLP